VPDLRLLTAEPSEAERAAIDAVIGEATPSDGRTARDIRTRRHELLPALRAAQLQLGRRIGLEGRADAAPVSGDSIAPALPFLVQDAVAKALAQGPAWRIARANERTTSGQLWARRAQYLPRATLDFNKTANDTRFFPSSSKITSFALTVSLPLWDNGQREIQVAQARANHEVAQAIRDDLERGAWHDVTAAYDAYETNRATIDLDRYAVVVARENNRVQETRYRSGATTILDLLDAQNRLFQAEADLVQAMYNTRLARAGLAVILGERINFEQGPQCAHAMQCGSGWSPRALSSPRSGAARRTPQAARPRAAEAEECRPGCRWRWRSRAAIRCATRSPPPARSKPCNRSSCAPRSKAASSAF